MARDVVQGKVVGSFSFVLWGYIARQFWGETLSRAWACVILSAVPDRRLDSFPLKNALKTKNTSCHVETFAPIQRSSALHRVSMNESREYVAARFYHPEARERTTGDILKS